MHPSIRIKSSRHFAKSETNILDRIQAIASIASAIAIPIVLAIAGFFIQRQLADEGLKKDYVSIATNILKEDSKKQEPELRAWAVMVLDANSPVPFSSKAKQGLQQTGIYISAPHVKAPVGCMEIASKPRITPYFNKLAKDVEIQKLSREELRSEFFVVLKLALEAESEAQLDRAKLTCLQRYAGIVTDGQSLPIQQLPNSQSSPEKSSSPNVVSR